jgi:hypothetical protein
MLRSPSTRHAGQPSTPRSAAYSPSMLSSPSHSSLASSSPSSTAPSTVPTGSGFMSRNADPEEFYVKQDRIGKVRNCLCWCTEGLIGLENRVHSAKCTVCCYLLLQLPDEKPVEGYDKRSGRPLAIKIVRLDGHCLWQLTFGSDRLGTRRR